jgi:hypothetical protein
VEREIYGTLPVLSRIICCKLMGNFSATFIRLRLGRKIPQ